jgi:hypothetical protein
MPCILVHDTDFESAYNTSENVSINVGLMDLTSCAAAAPPEVRVVVECFAEGEIVKSNVPNKW